ncbi:MAG: hypothetical protein VZR02_03675 [Lachnospiraceae bacterium]|nr:hypothetical protein [Lachnospiraceae bacterium]
MPEYDYHDALLGIEMLFQSHILSFGYKEYSLETFADKKYFSAWKGREGAEDTDQMRQGLHIDGILEASDPSENEVLTYLQYTFNIAELVRRNFHADNEPGYSFEVRNYTELLARIRELLGMLSYEAKYVEDREYIFLVPRDPALDAMLPASKDPVTDAIIEYSSLKAEDSLDRKKAILQDLYGTVAGFEDNNKLGSLRLMHRIDFLLETMGVTDGEDGTSEEAKNKARALADSQKEDWYDEAYQLLLLRILEHSSLARMDKVDAWAEELGLANLEITEEEMAALLSGPGVPGTVPADTEALRTVEDLPAEEDRAEIVPAKNHAVRNVIIAVILADLLFITFLLVYFMR